VFLVKQPCECEPSFLHPPYCSLFLAICLVNAPRSCGCSIFSSLGERERERERHWFCTRESERRSFGDKGFLPERVWRLERPKVE